MEADSDSADCIINICLDLPRGYHCNPRSITEVGLTFYQEYCAVRLRSWRSDPSIEVPALQNLAVMGDVGKTLLLIPLEYLQRAEQ